MKNFMKRAALLLLMITSAFPVWAAIYTGSCGDNATYTLDTESGLLKIEGNGKMDSYSSPFNVAPWRWYDVTHVLVADGITNIGQSAFSGCSSIAAITIPNTITSIDNFAFSGEFSMQVVINGLLMLLLRMLLDTKSFQRTNQKKSCKQ